MSDIGKITVTRGVKEVLDLIMQGALIALESQDVIPALLDDLLGDFGLTAHRINGHDTARQLKEFQQLRDRLDFVRLLLGGFSPQYQSVAVGPSADHVQRRFAAAAITRAACAQHCAQDSHACH